MLRLSLRRPEVLTAMRSRTFAEWVKPEALLRMLEQKLQINRVNYFTTALSASGRGNLTTQNRKPIQPEQLPLRERVRRGTPRPVPLRPAPLLAALKTAPETPPLPHHFIGSGDRPPEDLLRIGGLRPPLGVLPGREPNVATPLT